VVADTRQAPRRVRPCRGQPPAYARRRPRGMVVTSMAQATGKCPPPCLQCGAWQPGGPMPSTTRRSVRSSRPARMPAAPTTPPTAGSWPCRVAAVTHCWGRSRAAAAAPTRPSSPWATTLDPGPGAARAPSSWTASTPSPSCSPHACPAAAYWSRPSSGPCLYARQHPPRIWNTHAARTVVQEWRHAPRRRTPSPLSTPGGDRRWSRTLARRPDGCTLPETSLRCAPADVLAGWS